MPKFLYVGDPHVQISTMAEAEKLMTFIVSVARINQVDGIILLGDLFHTHAIIRVEVQAFWSRWLYALGLITHVYVVAGNHDMSGDYHVDHNALQVFRHRENVTIIESAFRQGAIGFMPYFHDKDRFIEEANSLAGFGVKTLICHQSFSGSKFENGYFDPNGINPDLINVDKIISGHIHLGQEFGKVWHPGTAMWLTTSDANQTKGIWVVQHGEDGSIVSRTFVDTSDVVVSIRSYIWNEGEEKPVIPKNVKAAVELVGTSEWIALNKKELIGVAIKSTITDAKTTVRVARKNLREFIGEDFDLVSTLDRHEFLEFCKELELV